MNDGKKQNKIDKNNKNETQFFSCQSTRGFTHLSKKKKNPIRIFEEQGGGQPIFRVLLKIFLPPLTLSVS